MDRGSVRRCGGTLAAIALLVGLAPAARAGADWVAAVAARQTPRLSAYARVQSTGLLTIAPPAAGVIARLAVVPGDQVAAGAVIAELGGPDLTAAMTQAEAEAVSAAAAKRAAAGALDDEQHKLRQRLSTHQLVGQAQTSLAAAIAQAATATARLAALRQSIVLRSPRAGTVQQVAVAVGDVVAAGAPVATIETRAGTWLRATFYQATEADVAAGTVGRFTPSDGGAPVAVVVRGSLGLATADGGLAVALSLAAPLPRGTFGTVSLRLPPRTVTMVRSDALILDQGRWWIMRHDPTGDHKVAVTRGESEGDDTVITAGVAPGDQVVVVNAYLIYHRGIGAVYAPPD